MLNEWVVWNVLIEKRQQQRNILQQESSTAAKKVGKFIVPLENHCNFFKTVVFVPLQHVDR